ncbi:hypothetical protein DYE48_14800 [Halobacillus trueperi]|uniref:Uncharacterized protein n=1 Tax=Halobacillus trueperi TaxID=156205 RepID=A0A3E0J637_9BACI|nr:hypothetical protein DYE48_14800 [Halobacillus trueperi]
MEDAPSWYRGSFLTYIEWGGWEAARLPREWLAVIPAGKRVASQPPLTPNMATKPEDISKLSLEE